MNIEALSGAMPLPKESPKQWTKPRQQSTTVNKQHGTGKSPQEQGHGLSEYDFRITSYAREVLRSNCQRGGSGTIKQTSDMERDGFDKV
eukprot:6482033-Amphidinium_carterae.1